MLNKLLKLSNKLDLLGFIKDANEIDIIIKIAAKIDELKKKYPNHEFEIDKINEADPSPTKKYLEWGAKQINTGIYTTHEVATAIKQFHQYHQKLENKDINSYKTIEEVERALVGKDLPSKRKLKEISKSGADVIYESPNYIVIHPKTKESACAYGAGTKWCITMKNESHYENYSNKGIIFYYIFDRHPKDEIMNKVAIAMKILQDDGIVEVFDAQDRQIDLLTIKQYYGNEYTNIMNAIDGHADTEGIKSAEEYMMNMVINGDEEERYNIANSANVSVAILDLLAKDDNSDIRAMVAKRLNASQEILDLLSKDKSVHVRMAVAANTKSSPDTLALLAQDNDEYVNRAVAQNISTSQETLNSMAIENKGTIPLAIARNRNTSSKTLAMLSDYQDENVRIYVAGNPNATSDILDKLAKKDYDLLAGYVGKNKNTSPNTLDYLATMADPSHHILLEIIIYNPNTSIETLNKITKNPDSAIRGQAYITLDRRNAAKNKQSSRKQRLQKLSEQLLNKYYPLGQKGNEDGGNIDQQSEVAEEINDEMETKEMDGVTPGTDNLIIDKNNNPTDGFGVLALLEKYDILLKGRSKWKSIASIIRKMNDE